MDSDQERGRERNGTSKK
jgi:hypothetical protein